MLANGRLVGRSRAPYSLGVRDRFDAKGLRELGRVKEILRIALIEHLIGLPDIGVEQAGNLDERAAENPEPRLDSKFPRHHLDELLSCQRTRCRRNMPGLIPGRFR